MVFDLFDYILGIIKLCIYKVVYGRRLKINLKGKFSSSTQIRIFDKGNLCIGGNMTFRAGVKIRINGGCLYIGNNAGFNNYCCINCMDNITIGDNVIIGQGVMFYDHDHDYKKGGIIRDNGFKTETIRIGNNVWIGSNCMILRGADIGDGCVIAAGSIVMGKIQQNTLVYNERTLETKPIKMETL